MLRLLTANTGQSEKNRTQENCLLPYHLLTVHQKKIPSDQISFAADAAEFQEGNNKYTVKTPYEDKEIQISAYTDGEPLTKANEEYASIKPGQLLWLSDSCYLRKKENGYQITDKDSKNQLLYSQLPRPVKGSGLDESPCPIQFQRFAARPSGPDV